jgi:hypothetical protein
VASLEDPAEPSTQARAPPGACRRRAAVAAAGFLGPSFPVGKERVDALTYLPLDEATAAGGSLEFIGHAQVLGTPLPQPTHGLNTDIGADRGMAEIGQRAFGAVKERVLR